MKFLWVKRVYVFYNMLFCCIRDYLNDRLFMHVVFMYAAETDFRVSVCIHGVNVCAFSVLISNLGRLRTVRLRIPV